MKANYLGERGVRVIRPLVFAREAATRAFSVEAQLPIINENCPACFEQVRLWLRFNCPLLSPELKPRKANPTHQRWP